MEKKKYMKPGVKVYNIRKNRLLVGSPTDPNYNGGNNGNGD